MKSSLKEALKKHYGTKELSRGQLDELMSLQKTRSRPRKRSTVVALVATAASVLVSLFYVYHQALDPLHKRIAQEVAYNHNKKMAMEVVTHSMPRIQSTLDRLDFTLVEPLRLASRYDILGARYCSIQGKIAAQIKVRKVDSGEVYTLYQVPIREGWDESDLVGKKEAIDGVVVDIWTEKGLLLALAGKDIAE